MPIYEFACKSCGHEFEELVGPHVGLDAKDVVCPACSAPEPERRISGYAPIHRQMTTNEKRRLEEKRGGDLTKLKSDFSKRRKASREARDAAKRRAGGGER